MSKARYAALIRNYRNMSFILNLFFIFYLFIYLFIFYECNFLFLISLVLLEMMSQMCSIGFMSGEPAGQRCKMEDYSAVFIGLLFFTFSVQRSSAGEEREQSLFNKYIYGSSRWRQEVLHVGSTPKTWNTHSLQFLYTAVTPGKNVTAVGLLNGEQFVYYDSNIKKMIPKTEWLQKISTDDTNYWNRETERVKDHQYQLQDIVTTMKRLNQAEGDHTLQWMFGCGLDNGTIRGYSQYRYDGEDFMSLDLNWNQEPGHGNWIAANEKAEIFIKEWNHKGENVIYWMNYLKTKCIDQLKKFVPHGRETLESKVHSKTPVCQKLSPFPELVCNATGVFPKPVMISWRKDGEDMHENVKLRMSLINQDGSFQMRSIMKVSVEELQKHNYTCVIQHSSLGEELVPNVNKHRTRRDVESCIGSGGGSDRGHVGIIVSVVVTLLVLVAFVGMFIWKKKNGTELRYIS